LALLIRERIDDHTLVVDTWQGGQINQPLIKIGYPVEDLAGYVTGAPLEVRLRKTTLAGEPFRPRAYQEEAAQAFYAGGSSRGDTGVIVLPCGAGKTVVGLRGLSLTNCYTLILVTNVTAARQWLGESGTRPTLPRI